MARLRYNGLATGASGSTVGLSLGASLTSSATAVTLNAALTHSNGTAVPTIVSPDYIPLEILDANGRLSEIVYLTAYTAAATTGTISRGNEGTAGVAHSSGDKIVHGPTKLDTQTDPPPSAPNAKDDEFDGASSVSWSSTPTAPAAWDINVSRPGHAYVKTSGTGGNYVGKVQSAPGSFPFAVTTKLASTTRRANNQRGGGLILGPASPTSTSNLLYFGALFAAGNYSYERIIAQFGSAFVSQSSAFYSGYLGPMYLRLVVNSASSVDCYLSLDGWLWGLVENVNPGFTPGVIGLALNDETAAIGCEAFFDFFRVT